MGPGEENLQDSPESEESVVHFIKLFWLVIYIFDYKRYASAVILDKKELVLCVKPDRYPWAPVHLIVLPPDLPGKVLQGSLFNMETT